MHVGKQRYRVVSILYTCKYFVGIESIKLDILKIGIDIDTFKYRVQVQVHMWQVYLVI